MGVPLLPADHGAMLELALAAVGGFRDIDGTRPPDVSSTASCFRWSLKVACGPSQLEGRRGRCEGSFGGGAGGTVPGEISDSFSLLLHGVSRRCLRCSEWAVWRCAAASTTGQGGLVEALRPHQPGAQPHLNAIIEAHSARSRPAVSPSLD
jgi:hypothetical protein